MPAIEPAPLKQKFVLRGIVIEVGPEPQSTDDDIEWCGPPLLMNFAEMTLERPP
jgi:hypothetical protein